MSKAVNIQCVFVEWIDSCHMDAWHKSDSLEGAKSEFSVGVLVKDEPEFITIALSWAQESEEYGHLIAIPKVAIRYMQIFKKSNKGVKRATRVRSVQKDTPPQP